MSIKSELSVLKVNIQNAKDKLYTNLVDKGVTDITTASTLDAMANSVSDIVTGTSSGGGNPFDAIGYEATPQYIQDNIDYSQTIYDNWDASITSCNGKFKGNKQLVYCPLVDTSNVTTMESMFSGCTYLQYVPQINTSKVTTMNSMFASCYDLTSLVLSGWNTSKVTNMSGMFYYCFKLTTLDLSSFNTSIVTNMKDMFSYCSGLTSLNLSSFDTSKVTNMYYMFNKCYGLTSLDLSNFDTSNVTNMYGMFNGCKSLTSLDLSSFDTSNVTIMQAMFNECSGLTSLDLSSFDTSKVTNMGSMFIDCKKLIKIDGYISFKSYSSSTMSSSYMFSSNSTLKKVTFKDVGYDTNAKQFNMSYNKSWGVNDSTITDAKQSLIDSLITYSFDRATNGYSTCTVTLAANTKAVLTDDEIAQITAKGYTIA